MNFECPRCDAWMSGPANRMHHCKGLAGLAVYFVPAGTKAKVEAHEREDYVGSEIVQTDGLGRPMMSVVTTRDEGEDAVVYAPTALGKVTPDEYERLLSRVGTTRRRVGNSPGEHQERP